jgi:uncharacterized protein (TIGR01777 family)
MKKSVLIAGGSGLVGSRLIELLDPYEYDIRLLSRNSKRNNGIESFHWDFDKMTINPEAVKVDFIINLNGAGIAEKRWTDARKKVLIESRVKSAELIASALKKTKHRPKVYISASAIGYYGDRGNEVLDENSAAGRGFMAECCQSWEEATTKLSSLSDRLIINRIGIVLSTKGGALSKMLLTKNIGVYNYFGKGDRYYSWIHIDDLCRLFIHQLQNESCSGIYNCVTPKPITNRQFMTQIKNALKGNLVMPIPEFGLRLLLGEMANVVLNSTRVFPRRLEKESFRLKFPDLNAAIKDLVRRDMD